jgi:hypothetical protein
MVVSITPIFSVGVEVVDCTGGELAVGLVTTGGTVVVGPGAGFREKVQPAVQTRTITSRVRRQMNVFDLMMFIIKVTHIWLTILK